MPALFAYTGRLEGGRFVAGSLQAQNREEALAHLRTRALFVTSLSQSASASGAVASLIAAWPVSANARTAFFRSFATLIRAGVPIRRALEVATGNCRDARLREALEAVSSDIEGGSELSGAMLRRPKEFSRVHVAMIRAGEVGGALDEILERLASLLERHNATRKRLRAAMAYPLIVAAAAVALVLFLVGSTMPAFASMFVQMHVALPWTTRVLMAMGEALRSPLAWIALAAAAAAGAALVRLARRFDAAALQIDRLVLAAPVFGSVIRKAVIARFARTLGTLLHAGVPLLAAIEAAADVVENAVYLRFARLLGTALGEGTAIAAALERSALFDDICLALVSVGEETGTLDAMLLRVADYHELDVETAISALGNTIEPMLIIVLGAVVGIIVASILIPLYSMIGSIR
ncbi:MAG TPA: type II secretion system F family protein [Candidatus Acidoferrales bacterium]|nr:type II secretion system F family protein [Candidatus Acidoferrales bacterium]